MACKYEVHIDNVGTVFSDSSLLKAMKSFEAYVLSPPNRSDGSIYLLKDGHISIEHELGPCTERMTG